MEGTRKLEGWQFGILVGLLVLLISTMFMPAFHYNGKVVDSMCSDIIESVKSKAGILSSIVENVIDTKELREKYDDYIKSVDADLEKMKEDDIDLTSFSPFRIMRHSLIDYITNDDDSQEDIEEIKESDNYKKLSKVYNSLRVLLIVEYSLALIVLILVIAGFAAGWSKKIPLIISIVYGVLSAAIFGYLRFGLLRLMGKKCVDFLLPSVLDNLPGDLGLVANFGKTVAGAFLGKLLVHLYSMAFLIAFIIAILFLVMSIVSLAVGNKVEVLDYDRDYDYGGDWYDDNAAFNSEVGMTAAFSGDIAGGFQSGIESNIGGNIFDINGMNNVNAFPEEPIPVTGAAQPSSEPIPFNAAAASTTPTAPVIPTQPMGRVRCTKGVAVGQGFQLPQDRKVIVGKSPSKSNLTVNHPNISNVHCSIRYNPATNMYIVKDHSTNGTFVNGNRLPKDTPLEYPAGTVLVLADGTNEITLG